MWMFVGLKDVHSKYIQTTVPLSECFLAIKPHFTNNNNTTVHSNDFVGFYDNSIQ